MSSARPDLELVTINSGMSGDNSRGGLYRFGRDVREHDPDLVTVNFGVNDAFSGAGELLRPAGGEDKRYFDLPLANHTRLAAAGVQHIELSDLCTACRTDLFFSHRAEKGRTGRFGTVFILE